VNRKSWLTLAVLIVVALGGWLVSSIGPGSAGRTPVPAGTSAPSDATTTGTQRSSPTSSASSASMIDPVSGLPWISVAELPPQAHDVLRRIDSGGPFKYDKDGATFNNFEGLLPPERRGYYREYTVDTPGSRDRGARRIVTGDNDRIRYWTADHYESFARIRQ
jgi:ribonuclease T1